MKGRLFSEWYLNWSFHFLPISSTFHMSPAYSWSRLVHCTWSNKETREKRKQSRSLSCSAYSPQCRCSPLSAHTYRGRTVSQWISQTTSTLWTLCKRLGVWTSGRFWLIESRHPSWSSVDYWLHSGGIWDDSWLRIYSSCRGTTHNSFFRHTVNLQLPQQMAPCRCQS